MPIRDLRLNHPRSIDIPRWWVARGQEYPADADGFVTDDEESRRFLSHGLKTLDELRNCNIVLALGDPGLGKTRDIEEFAERLAQDPSVGEDRLLAFALSEFDTRRDIVERVFESPTIRRWREGSYVLHLILDSLDESRVPLDAVASTLLGQLRQLPLERLRLLLACRTAAVPERLGDNLQRLAEHLPTSSSYTETMAAGEWLPAPAELDRSYETQESPPNESKPDPFYAEVEITVLSRVQVRQWAAALLGSETRADEFLAQVTASGCAPFAARPLSLSPLLARFASGQLLDADHVSLFRENARNLTVRSRRESTTHDDRIPAATRYRAVGRLCAMITFGNYRGFPLSRAATTDRQWLSLYECAGHETIDNVDVRIDEFVMRDALDTAFFTAVGGEHVTAHQALREFMAAEWVHSNRLNETQILSLVRQDADEGDQILPQLRNAAVWLASQTPDVMRSLLKTDPELLLWSESAEVPESLRAVGLEVLLERIRKDASLSLEYATRRRLRRLRHEGMEPTLLRVLKSSGEPVRLKELALQIGAACACKSLSEVAADMVLSDGLPLGLRIEAARFLAAAGVHECRWVIMTILDGDVPADENDELFGAVLEATWRLLSPSEMFSAVRLPKRRNWYGIYQRALSVIAAGLTAEYVQPGMQWLLANTSIASEHALSDLASALLRKALEQSDVTAVRRLVAGFVASRLAQHRPLIGEFASADREVTQAVASHERMRREIIRHLVSCTVAPSGQGCDRRSGRTVPIAALYQLARWESPLMLPEDVPWAVDVMCGLDADDPRRMGWRVLLMATIGHGKIDHARALLARRGDADVNALLRPELSSATSAEEYVALAGSSEARSAQAEAERTLVDEASVRAAPQAMRERIVAALKSRSDTMEEDVWRRSKWTAVFFEIGRDTASGAVHPGFSMNQLVLARRALARHEWLQVISAASSFLADVSPLSDPFPSTGRLPWVSLLAGWCALLLVVEHGQLLSTLPSDVLLRWVPTLVKMRPFEAEFETVQEEVVRSCLNVGGSLVKRALADDVLLRLGGQRHALPDAALHVAADDSEVRRMILQEVGASAVDIEEVEEFFRLLLRRDIGTNTLIWALVREERTADRPIQNGDRTLGGRMRVAATSALLSTGGPTSAEGLLEEIEEDDEFARAVLLQAAARNQLLEAGVANAVAASVLARLYVLLERLWPAATDPWYESVYSPGAEDNLRSWRSRLLRILEERRTAESVSVLRSIAEALPAEEGLAKVWRRAQRERAAEQWRGMLPAELSQLAEHASARLVRSNEQLLAAIEESLGRFQADLQGELRSVVGLWDEQRGGGRQQRCWVPKQEWHLANEVARHLRRDIGYRGAIVGREMVVQVGIGGGDGGLRTDIDVQARPSQSGRSTDEVLRAIIEVKGSWNTGVASSLKRQLVEKYLAPHDVPCGVYVVGFYTTSRWCRGAPRQRSQRLGTLEQLRRALSTQAEAATDGFRRVRAVVLDMRLPEMTT